MKAMRAGWAVFLVATTGVMGGEHPACRDVDFPYRSSTPVELRDIARTCARPRMAELYYHRARYAELVADHAVMSRLEQGGRSRGDRWTAGEGALFIALVETISAAGDLTPAARVEVINTAFEHTIAIAELSLRGYDRQADRLRNAGIRAR